MFDTVVVATDGSESVLRAVDCALDLADRFDAAVHALYVVDASRLEALPEDVRDEVRGAISEQAEEALSVVVDATDREVTTAVREGQPAAEINKYAHKKDADLVATGTRGRNGEHSFLLGSVAEDVVRTCEAPVLTVRQLEEDVAKAGT